MCALQNIHKNNIVKHKLNNMLLHLHLALDAILYGTKSLFYFHYICYNNNTLKKEGHRMCFIVF